MYRISATSSTTRPQPDRETGTALAALGKAAQISATIPGVSFGVFGTSLGTGDRLLAAFLNGRRWYAAA